MSHTFEQFVRFSTDSVGLERTLRLFQALAQILSSFSLPFSLLLYLLSITSTTSPPPSPATIYTILSALRQRLALARRFLRLFRFLESFDAAQKLYTSLSTTSSGKEKGWARKAQWLDVGARSFNGMYLLLEAATIVDALQIEGLALWTPGWERAVSTEAQRFWLFALVCGVGAGTLRILDVLAHTPVPASNEDVKEKEKEKEKAEVGMEEETNEKGGQEGEGQQDEAHRELKREQERLRTIVAKRKAERRRWIREVKTKVHKLGRGVVANALDITLPGSAIGWVPVDAGTVGLATLVTTVLTGMDVWERCGREVEGGK
ncbi:peroxisomal biogenesis factor 11 [Whalleya microplaca]|nr:peroxisomal biogenesis factor 11 [Whalleya microplaca]